MTAGKTTTSREVIANKTAPIDWTLITKEVTRRIVASVAPQRVILFGSAVNGKLSADSDLDILVIMRGVVHRRQTAQKIYRDLQGVGAPVDVVVVTEEDIVIYGDKPGTILRPALTEGQVLFDAHWSYWSAELVKAGSQQSAVGAKRQTKGGRIEDLCFNAQQAAEKALKAVCLHAGQDFPKIHSISRLLEIIESFGISIPDEVKAANILTQYAVQTRYPGPIEEVTLEEYKRFIGASCPNGILGWNHAQGETMTVFHSTDSPLDDILQDHLTMDVFATDL